MNNSFDHDHIWHPYSAMHSDLPVYKVESAKGVRLKLDDGRELIDGMSSWWSVIHGYNQPHINASLEQQLKKMSHVMFGGLTHEPAIKLGQQLLEITPAALQNIFFADSGSVSVEVAMKMAIQYWHAKEQPGKQHFISLRSGYHGDTFAAMSVCDPDTGMHSLFKDIVAKQYFVAQPCSRFGETCSENDIAELEKTLELHNSNIAALIMEPIVQGAGGMWFYSADYLKQAKALCEKYNVLLILDEIATGFGRTGKLFASEHAGICPDIMCIGKALTGGYMTLAATLTTDEVANSIDQGQPGVLMHGPTFMANPLACAAASASIELLLSSDWKKNITRIQNQLIEGFEVCKSFSHVDDVRVLGAIGVIEMKQPVNMKTITEAFVNKGVWVRPFGKLVYVMPPFVISESDLKQLIDAVVEVVSEHTNP